MKTISRINSTKLLLLHLYRRCPGIM